MKHLLLAFAALFLSACTTFAPLLPVQNSEFASEKAADFPTEFFTLNARFSVNVTNEKTQSPQNHSGKMTWRHFDKGDEILLFSPFGQTVAKLEIDPIEARLTLSDGRIFSEKDSAQLTQNVLGFSLPIAQLQNWVRGKKSEADDNWEEDAQNRLIHLVSGDWQIRFSYEENAGENALPILITADKHNALSLRLRVDEWRY